MTVTQLDPMLPQRYRVLHIRRELADTFTIELEPEDDNIIPSFAAGQFNMLYVYGKGEIPISISGDPTKHRPLVHTIHAVGTVSMAMRELKPGDVIGVRGPFGNPWPIELGDGNDVIIVAEGRSLAQLRSAIYQIIARREEYGRVVLLYGARSPSDILYHRELENWRGMIDLEVYVTVDHITPAWRGSVGVVTRLIPRVPLDPNATLAFVCGPEVMMHSTTTELAKRGVAAERIYVSLERNMKCAIGLCGHCQYGPHFVCKNGPVFQYSSVRSLFSSREV